MAGKMMEGDSFSTDGEGNWWKLRCEKQCPVDDVGILEGRCQGVEGHAGVHWLYTENGCFRWSDNKSNPEHGGACGLTPPGHANYRTPELMIEHYYASKNEWIEFTDTVEIERLERGELRDGESVTRPVKPGEWPE